MGGEIHLHESFSSGIPGCPGARFVVNLCQQPLEVVGPSFGASNEKEQMGEHGSATLFLHRNHHDDSRDQHIGPNKSTSPILPENLSVLFVDDDTVLRKLFARMVKPVARSWNILQAANGETAIQLTDTIQFDLIFMDMYMASVEKQLLGTEAVKILRNNGVQCKFVASRQMIWKRNSLK